jgi:PKD repeat protein
MRPPGGPYNQSHAARFRIYNEDGEKVADEGTSDYNGYADSRGTSDRPYSVFELSDTGTYTIVATTGPEVRESADAENPAYTSEKESDTDTFEYELRLHQFVGEPTPIEYNTSVNGSLTPQSNYNDYFNGYYNVYSFNAQQDDRAWIRIAPQDATKESHATNLILFGPDNQREFVGAPENGAYSISGINLLAGSYTLVTTSGNSMGESPYVTEAESHTATFNYNLSIVDGPTAAFTATSKGNKTFEFDARNSSLPGGEITRYEWDFDDDGETENNGATVTHTYDTSGRYNVTLTVTASESTSDTASQVVDIGQAHDDEGSAASIVAPSDTSYSPTEPLIIGTVHNATGTIDGGNVAIRLVNATAGNETIVAQNNDVAVAEQVNTTIPAGSLSGDVTVETQLYDLSTQRVVATDSFNLTSDTPDGEDDIVSRYDVDGDGLETSELLTGIGDWRGGDIETQELLTLIDAWRSNSAN